MDKITKFKEAIKISIAIVIVYGIALKISWMNPYWAGFGVIMIALPTAGQSLNKGLNRLLGTIPGCLGGLIIFSLAAQNRWLILILACVFIAITAYMNIRSKNHAYIWFVAGFTCLLILISSPITSDNIFNHALFRTLETAMGITVYTLTTVFLWPRTNYGAIKKAGSELLSTQLARMQTTISVREGREKMDKLIELRQQNIQKVTQVNAALTAEGSESYEIKEVRPQLERFAELSSSLLEMQNRMESNLEEFYNIDLNAVFPGLNDFQKNIEDRFVQMKAAIDGSEVSELKNSAGLKIDKEALLKMSEFDKAAMEVGIQNFEHFDKLSQEMYLCVIEITGNAQPSSNKEPIKNIKEKKSGWVFIPDPEDIKGSLFATATVFFGFCVWIFFNPTGHGGWFQMTGTLGLMLAATPQIRAMAFFKPMALIFPLGILAYVFIMPQLSSFFGLAILLFSAMFIVAYFFSGIGQTMGYVAVVNMISIQNHQTYNFAALANSYFFTLACVVFVFVLSYMISSSRPEKVVLKFIHRFFTHTEFLLSQLAPDNKHKQTFFEKWKTDYIHKELRSLPGKINKWSRSIDHKLYPNITPDQINVLVTSLQGFVYRIDELYEANAVSSNSMPTDTALRNDMINWNNELIKAFAGWSVQPGRKLELSKEESVNASIEAFEKEAKLSINKLSDSLSAEDIKRFYSLLGSYRGLTTAVVNYAQIAPGIDLKSWSEERFS